MSKDKIEKPGWFSAEKYDDAYNFTKEQWFEQVAIRFFLYQVSIYDKNYQVFVNHFEKIKEQKKPFIESPESILIFIELLQKPLLNNRVKTIGDLLMRNDTNQIILPNLWSTTTSEVTKNFAILKNSKNEFESIADINNWHKENSNFSMSPVNKLRTRAIDDLLNDDILGRAHLTVDLNGTKKEIKKDFDSWLEHSKSHFDKGAKRQLLSDTKIRIWANDRILAYLDLLIWCKLEKIEIGTNKILTEERLVEWVDVRIDYEINNAKNELNKLKNKLMTFNSIINLYKYAFGSMSQQQISRTFTRFIKKRQIDLSDLFSG